LWLAHVNTSDVSGNIGVPLFTQYDTKCTHACLVLWLRAKLVVNGGNKQ